jgi:hypothetical protein
MYREKKFALLLFGAFAKYQIRLLDSSCLSVRPFVHLLFRMELGSHWTDCMKFAIYVFFENLSRKLQFN